MSSQKAKGCSTLSFGYVCLGVGIAFLFVGWFWHFPRVTHTNAVIIESVRVPSARMLNRVTYEYTANGMRYRGQCLTRLGSQPARFLEVGESFPVYFVTNKPQVSYAPLPPRISIFIVFGILFSALGAVLIFFTWQLTPSTASHDG